MSNKYNINILRKSEKFIVDEEIRVFIDGEEIKSEKKLFNFVTSEGKHRLKIEQKKLYKNKYSFLLVPVYQIFCGMKEISPLYAMYEAEIFLDRDIDIAVEINKSFRGAKFFGKILDYVINITYKPDINVSQLKRDVTATDNEKKYWLILSVASLLLPIITIIILSTIYLVDLIMKGEGIGYIIFLTVINISLIVFLVFGLGNCYFNYKR